MHWSIPFSTPKGPTPAETVTAISRRLTIAGNRFPGKSASGCGSQIPQDPEVR
jgi:hypothetical protein